MHSLPFPMCPGHAPGQNAFDRRLVNTGFSGPSNRPWRYKCLSKPSSAPLSLKKMPKARFNLLSLLIKSLVQRLTTPAVPGPPGPGQALNSSAPRPKLPAQTRRTQLPKNAGPPLGGATAADFKLLKNPAFEKGNTERTMSSKIHFLSVLFISYWSLHKLQV